MSRIVAAKLHRDGKIYHWNVPEEMEIPQPGQKVLVECQGTIAPAKVVAIVENPDYVPTASLVNEKYSLWRKEHPSKNEIARKEELGRWEQDGLDISQYKKEGYSIGQLQQLRMGLKMGLNVSIFADRALSPDKMEKKRRTEMLRIAKALGLIPDGLTMRQTRELLAGLEQNVDITQFNSPSISWKKMHFLRLCLQAGMAPEELVDLTSREIKELWNDIKNQKDIEREWEGEMEL